MVIFGEYQTWLLFLLVIAITGVQRAIYRFFYPGKIFFDTYAHMFRVKHLRQYRKTAKQVRPNDPLLIKTRFLKPASTNDPFLVLKLLSYFPERWMPFLERYVNAVIDGVYAGGLFLAIVFIRHNFLESFLGALVYTFTPIFFTVQSTGPRTFGFTPRMLAECFGGISLIFLYFFLQYHFFFLYVIAAIFSALAMMSNGFAGQALFFIPIFLSFFVHQLLIIALPFFGFLIASLLGQKNFLRVFKFHVVYMAWYFMNNLRGKMTVSDRNSVSALVRAFSKKSISLVYKQFFSKNSFLILLIKYPCFLFAIGLTFFAQTTSLVDNFLLSGLFVFVLTSVKYFLSLGEAERYLHYLVFFVILKLEIFHGFFALSVFFIFYGILFQCLDFFWLYFQSRNQNRDPEGVFSWLNKKNKPKNIFVSPYALLDGWRLLLETKHNWVWPMYWDAADRNKFELSMRSFSHVDLERLNKLVLDYKIDLVILEAKSFNQYEFKNVTPPADFVRRDIFNDLVIFERCEHNV